METTALRELLKSFCSSSEWSYAVFWKLKQEGQMILEWEDGFCDYPRPRETVHGGSGFPHHNELEKLSCLDSATALYDGGSIELAVADMSSHQYIWGEGLIGKAACTGNHCWVLFDDYFSIGTGFSLVPELPNEWIPQFVAGIKTILVTPVLPHGVLLLGSLERVAENMAVVTYVKDRFSSFKTAMSGHSASCKFEMDISVRTAELSVPNFMDNLDKSSSNIYIQHDDCPSEATNGSGSIASNLENINISDQALLPPMRIDLPPLLKGPFGNTSGFQPPGLTKEPGSFDESLIARESRMTGSYFESSVAKPGLVSESYIVNTVGFGEASDGASPSFFSEDMMKQAVGVGELNTMCNTDKSHDCSLPVYCELYNSLNPSLQQQADNISCGAFEVPLEGVHNKMICDKNPRNGGQLAWKPGEWLDEGYGQGYLLEAVVANAYAGKNGSMSNISDNLKSSGYSKSMNQCEASTFIEDDSRGNVISSFVAEAQDKYSDSSSLTSFNSMISTLINKEQQIKGNHSMQPRYRANSKKKTGPGDSRKPRPRDRQLMQDYLTELRQLVPNGTKFTIDGLLEQTVKHILFLRSVTGQAEKVKLWTSQKVSTHKESRMRKNCQNGRSWALELGSEDPVCPIMVEDLDITGLLLIEILCNEEDIFLDTAQVIIQSGLSILKGEMENHANNKWAKFIVQATKDFHRMDIFWPLMQLLQGKTTRPTEN